MKLVTIFLLIMALLPGCTLFYSPKIDNSQIICLGASDSNKTWIYLCGLTDEFNASHEIAQRNILDHIGKKLNIRFLAIKPAERCPEFDNKLCWPHNSHTETLKTYDYILGLTGNYAIAGFIGFSNGGFFLNKIAQLVELNKPIISIGSAGYLENTSLKNDLYLVIGTQDIYHVLGAREFYNKSKTMQLNVTLIEFDGGHEIPRTALEDLLARI